MGRAVLIDRVEGVDGARSPHLGATEIAPAPRLAPAPEPTLEGSQALAVPQALAMPQAQASLSRWLRDILILSKIKITLFVALSTAAGFYLATKGPLPGFTFFNALLGTALLGAAASVLNQVLEREIDGKMDRTKGRPLPAGRMQQTEALAIGVFSALVGFFALALGTNWLAGSLGAASLLSYLFVYTPMKSRSHVSTVVGAVPGALPPLTGWAAARGDIGPGGLALFAILFLWQLPHFLAIARIYREDYARAGLPVLPVADPEGGTTARAIIVNCAAIIPAGLLPSYFGVTGAAAFAGALLLGLGYLAFGAFAALRPSPRADRGLLYASLVYLPALLLLFILDKA